MTEPRTGRNWQRRIVDPDLVMQRLRPGMSIFVGTGAAEPRTLVKQLLETQSKNLEDLTLVQLVSLADAISAGDPRYRKYRLMTFFSGWVASEAITAGRVDLVPCRFAMIPRLIESGQIQVDAAFIQISAPNETGYSSLGVSVDVARQVMEKASYKVGEICEQTPRTYGDTFVHVSEFDHLVMSREAPLTFPRATVTDLHDRLASNVASVIEDRSCIAFMAIPLHEALARHLSRRRHLGVHSPFFTDALMDLVESGAVSNRYKGIFRGKSLASYAVGTSNLMEWLNKNPMVEFQGLDKVFDPGQIARNPKFMAVLPARRVDLRGRIALPHGRWNVTAGPGEVMDLFTGAEMSDGGRSIFALPSRNRDGEPTIRLSVEDMPNLFTITEAVDMVITDFGVASLRGRTLRERAQALIDVAHPDDRLALVEQAKEARILYADQIFVPGSASLYPAEVATSQVLEDGLTVRFRAIRPSDEEQMRRLFYRFSDDTVYYRYFSHVRSMPHSKMQEYVNVDYRRTMSIVALVGEPGHGHIIGEARYSLGDRGDKADIAFVVEEGYQGKGIASFFYRMLIRLARDRGVGALEAFVLSSNRAMMGVLEKGDLPIHMDLEAGIYRVTVPLGDPARPSRP